MADQDGNKATELAALINQFVSEREISARENIAQGIANFLLLPTKLDQSEDADRTLTQSEIVEMLDRVDTDLNWANVLLGEVEEIAHVMISALLEGTKFDFGIALELIGKDGQEKIDRSLTELMKIRRQIRESMPDSGGAVAVAAAA